MAHIATADTGGSGTKKKTSSKITSTIGSFISDSMKKTSTAVKNAVTNPQNYYTYGTPSSSSKSSGGRDYAGLAPDNSIDYSTFLAQQQAAEQSRAALESMYSGNRGRILDYYNTGRDLYNQNLSNLDSLGTKGESSYNKNLSNISSWENTGTKNYNSNVADINSLKSSGLANYNTSAKNIDTYANQGQAAYNKNMQRINAAYGASNKYLEQAYQQALAQLQSNYEYQRGIANEDAEAAKREAYVNARLQDKNLASSLSAAGISGGASETTRAKLANALQNSINSVTNTTSRNLTNLGQTYNTNVSNMAQNRLNSLAQAETQKAQLLNAIEDMLTGVTGNVTNMRNSLNDSQTAFLTSITNALNAARDNYTAFTGNIANARNANESNYLAFLQGLTDSRNAANNNFSNFVGDYTNQMNNLELAYANQLMDYYSNYTPTYSPVGASGFNYTPQEVAAYQAASTAGIDPSALIQAISGNAQNALQQLQQAVDTSGFNNIQFQNPEDWSNYIKEIAELQNVYNPVTVMQGTPDNYAAQYQRYLAQGQMQASQGANRQQIANSLAQSGLSDPNTLAQILQQLGV